MSPKGSFHPRPFALSAGPLRRCPFYLVLALLAFGFVQAYAAGDADIKARIGFPYDNALVRANVPVFGVAWTKDLESYRLEFGAGHDTPKKWVLIRASKQPQPNDPWAQGKVKWSKDWGALKGNLGTWETGLDEYPYGQKFRHNLIGPYTLRLTVRDKKGRTAEHAMRVSVARALTFWTVDQAGHVEGPQRRVFAGP